MNLDTEMKSAGSTTQPDEEEMMDCSANVLSEVQTNLASAAGLQTTCTSHQRSEVIEKRKLLSEVTGNAS